MFTATETVGQPVGNNVEQNYQNQEARMEPYMVSLDNATGKSSGTNLFKETKDSNEILQQEIKSLEVLHLQASRDLLINEKASQKYQKMSFILWQRMVRAISDVNRSHSSITEVDLLMERVKQKLWNFGPEEEEAELNHEPTRLKWNSNITPYRWVLIP